jgi:hypothetical protein
VLIAIGALGHLGLAPEGVVDGCPLMVGDASMALTTALFWFTVIE